MLSTLPSLRSCVLLGLFVLLPIISLAQSNGTFTLTADSLQNGKAVELDNLNWKYAPSDDPRFADPRLDDRAWETLNGTAITLDHIPQSGWHGIGWFRLRLKADPALANQPVALVMVHYGASEIYLDGKLVQRFGTVGTTPATELEYNPNTVPLGILLDGRSEHVIAVRHSCMAMRDSTSWWSKWLHRLSSRQIWRTYTNRTNEFGAGFGIGTRDLKQAQAENERRKSLDVFGFDLYTSGLALAIGLLHLLLYWFYPSQRANLFFGLSGCLFSFVFTILYFVSIGHYGASGITFLYVVYQLLVYSTVVSAQAFFYTAFLIRLPKLFWLWPIAAVLFFFIALLNLLQWGGIIFFALGLFETLRVTIHAIRNRVEGAWIVGIGTVIAGIASFSGSIYILTGASSPLTFRMIAIFSLVLPPSIFLARRTARTNLDLKAQLLQVKQLSAEALEHEKVKAENERRARELEEARQLQLSMLPKSVPQLPHLEIAAYMKTATEVGGDYYDFHLTEDGTLTLAVGDATGHGMKAGTLVASIKSLFVSLAYHPDIPHIFHRMSRVLKEMKLRGLFMAMTMAKVKGNQLTVSIAGMPPVLVYRAASGEVEEVTLRAVPLGGLASYQYKQEDLTLFCCDVVVLMSDGLPERFNVAGEMLDYAATKFALAETAGSSPQQIIEHLVAVGEAWAGGRPQDDDVTFVVLKVKE